MSQSRESWERREHQIWRWKKGKERAVQGEREHELYVNAEKKRGQENHGRKEERKLMEKEGRRESSRVGLWWEE